MLIDKFKSYHILINERGIQIKMTDWEARNLMKG